MVTIMPFLLTLRQTLSYKLKRPDESDLYIFPYGHWRMSMAENIERITPELPDVILIAGVGCPKLQNSGIFLTNRTLHYQIPLPNLVGIDIYGCSRMLPQLTQVVML